MPEINDEAFKAVEMKEAEAPLDEKTITELEVKLIEEAKKIQQEVLRIAA